MKTCYNCLSSNTNCSWFNNVCSSKNPLKKNNNNPLYINSFLSKPYINSQYKCITNKTDIETFSFNSNKNGSITLAIPPDNLQTSEIINYHIYCFEMPSKINLLLTINYIEKYKNNIKHLSLYDNSTNTDKTLKTNTNTYNLKIYSDFFCIKITYELQTKTTKEKMISIILEQYNESNNKNNIKKSENILSYIILGCMILFITTIIWVFIIWHKNKSGIMKEITILNKANIYLEQQNETNESKSQDQGNNASNCDKSICSELQEKYLQLEQKSFVSHNYDTLDSFVNSIHDIDKRNKYLKTIIKTMPCFVIERDNRDLMGSFCHFCENKIKLNDNVCLLNCGHIFHYDCIYQQIITNEEYKCIICKESIII